MTINETCKTLKRAFQIAVATVALGGCTIHVENPFKSDKGYPAQGYTESAQPYGFSK